MQLEDAFFRQLIDTSADACAVIDREGRYLYANGAHDLMTGSKAAEICGRYFWDAFPASLGGPTHLAFLRIISGASTSERFETYFAPRKVWNETRLFVVSDLIVGLGRDMSAHHRSRDAIDRSAADTERLQTLTAALSRSVTLEEIAAVAVADSSKMAGATSALLYVLDPARGELSVAGAIGFDPAVIAPFATLPLESSWLVAKAARTRELAVLSRDAAQPEQGSIWDSAKAVRAVAVPLLVGGVCLGAMGLLFGEEHEPSEAQRRLLLTVGELLAQALQRARLFADVRAAEVRAEALYHEATRAVSARDEFIGVAGHELRTPLTVLQMQVDMLRRQARSMPDLVARADILRRQVQRLTRLTNQLLDFSRLSSGKLTLEPEELDLVVLVQQTAQRYSEVAAAPIRVSAPGSLRGSWDAARLEQIIDNLVGNAVKFGSDQPIEIEVAVEGNRARLEVKDHGIGIAPGEQQRIFERFERVVSSRNYGGFGLGLWICRQVTEAMGGAISVESEPGQGATFKVSLPLGSLP